ncbi:MAG: flavodoxin family protein [Victivallaceae bacterium]|nr:flavodoxin family protein [Victivallaceae bacterium]
MKILLINGSPRKQGNTVHALNAIAEGAQKHGHQLEFVNVCALSLKGCINCDCCKHNGGICVLADDGAAFMEKVSQADCLIFGSPVYWWGVSGQLKLALDKFYSKDEQFHKKHKKLAVVAVGAAELDDPEYRLVADQFRCIADFLGWEFLFAEAISAAAVNDLASDKDRLHALIERGETL